MSRIFVSHASADNAEAEAIRLWLAEIGFGDTSNDVFIDFDPQLGIAAGERWERALHDHAQRCEAVVFLVSRAWLAADWCAKEFDLAAKLSKQMIGVLIDDMPVKDIPTRFTATWQFTNLAVGADHTVFRVMVPPDRVIEQHVTFSQSGLLRLKTGLEKAGLDPRFFKWPPENDPDRAPYPGLSALEAADAGLFFGRNAKIVEALDTLRDLRMRAPPRLFVVQGASGAGKSSFLRAGLLPRLARDDRSFLCLPPIRPERAVLTGDRGLREAILSLCKDRNRPIARADISALLRDAGTSAGFHNLEALLADIAESASIPALPGEAQSKPPTLILAIDQAEELFSSDGQDEARGFLALLKQLIRSRSVDVLVICTIRTDRYMSWQKEFAAEGILEKGVSLPPLPLGAYQNVIEGPAQRFSAQPGRRLEFDPKLTEALMRDAEAAGGGDALPLLAFALERLWREHGDCGRLELGHYERLGKLDGIINAAVETALKAADTDPDVPRDRDARLALLRSGLIPFLAGIDGVTREPRRKVAALSQVPEKAVPLIRQLVEARLLTIDRSSETGIVTVEPAHEALLRQWQVMRGWLDEDAGLLAALEGVDAATRDWVLRERQPDWLIHHGGRLEDAEKLDARPDLASGLTPDMRAYLAACRKADNESRDRELEETRSREVQARMIAEQQKALAEQERKSASEQKSLAEKQRTTARLATSGLIAASLLALVAVGVGIYAEGQRREAEGQTTEAQKQTQIAETQTIEARRQAGVAEARSEEARRQTEIAIAQTNEAQRRTLQAENERRNALNLKEIAELFIERKTGIDGEVLTPENQELQLAQRMKNAALRGNFAAARVVGDFYFDGGGVLQSYSLAREWWQKAAAANDAMAMRRLGWLSYQGLGVPIDHSQAREWWEKAKNLGESRAMYNLGWMHMRGEGGLPRDAETGINLWKRAVAAGDVVAMTALAWKYLEGDSVRQDTQEAVRLWEQAAALDSAKAMRSLGDLYSVNRHVEADYSKARSWWERAAALGDGWGMNNLGAHYADGTGGIEVDLRKAREWLEKGAAVGNASAMKNLGMLLIRDGNSEQDHVTGLSWLKKAAENGSTEAMDLLARLNVGSGSVHLKQ